MTIADIGEDGILDILHARFFTSWAEDEVGPGDDAAVIHLGHHTAPGAGPARMVVCADTMNQDRSFRLSWPRGVEDNGYSTGWKLVAQNLSDLNAMGAIPTHLVISLALPGWLRVQWVEQFATGVMASLHYLGVPGVKVAGGDLTAGAEISASLTALGVLATEAVTQRSIRANPTVASSYRLIHRGHPGWAAAGLEVLESTTELPRALSRDAARAVRAQLRPRPELAVGPAVARQVVAMMDVSDGIGRDAHRLAKANRARVRVDPTWVRHRATELAPLAQALTGETATAEQWVHGGGEDYGLLAVIGEYDPIPDGSEVIGTLSPATTVDGESWAAAEQDQGPGWDHFRTS